MLLGSGKRDEFWLVRKRRQNHRVAATASPKWGGVEERLTERPIGWLMVIEDGCEVGANRGWCK